MCAGVCNAHREVHHDATCAAVLQEFKKAMDYPPWRTIDVSGHSGRHMARTAMNFKPDAPSERFERRVRARVG